MRKRSSEERHNRIRKLPLLGASVLILSLYLIFSYNNLKGWSYIYEPVFISIEGRIPENTSLELSYQTFNDPTHTHSGVLISMDSIPRHTYIFKIDSTHRLKYFSIYFRSLKEGDAFIISSIKASNAKRAEHSFSLENKDLIPSPNLSIDQLDQGGISIKAIPYDKPIGSSLSFYARNLNEHVLEKTNLKEAAIPGPIALLAILFLSACLFYSLFPLLSGLNWNGISLGAYFLALAILVLPTGEKISNLLFALAIPAGLMSLFRDGAIRNWMNENRGLLLIILGLISIYLIAFLFDSDDVSTQKILKIKYGLPMVLLAVAINTNYKREVRMQYAALLSGVIISVFMHLGWTFLLIDTVEVKSRLFSDPRYFLESSVFSRIHHSYLSILYLASLATMYLKREIISLSRRQVLLFSLLIFAGLVFAFSRAAILSLLLILVFFSLKWLFSQLKIEISRTGRFLAASALSIGLIALVFTNLEIDPATDNVAVKGLSTRMEIWTNAGDLIKQKPIAGHGPGNYKSALIESNSSSSFNINRWKVLNTHNQFLETAGMFGLPLALALLWFLLFPTGFTKQTVRFNDFIIAAAIIFGTAFFFESLLNRNLGVLAFGLCYGFLIKMRTIYGR